MNENDKRFYAVMGDLLKQRRMNQGLSLYDLEKLMNYKKTKSTLKRYEDGASKVDMGTLQAICDALNMDRDFFVKKVMAITNSLEQDDKCYERCLDFADFLRGHQFTEEEFEKLYEFAGYLVSKRK